MIQARALLENDWLTLEEIAERSGFKNVHYFNTVFKKNYGIPPGLYRKQLKDKTERQADLTKIQNIFLNNMSQFQKGAAQKKIPDGLYPSKRNISGNKKATK